MTTNTNDVASRLAALHDRIEDLARIVDRAREELAEARIAERDRRTGAVLGS